MIIALAIVIHMSRVHSLPSFMCIIFLGHVHVHVSLYTHSFYSDCHIIQQFCNK